MCLCISNLNIIENGYSREEAQQGLWSPKRHCQDSWRQEEDRQFVAFSMSKVNKGNLGLFKTKIYPKWLLGRVGSGGKKMLPISSSPIKNLTVMCIIKFCDKLFLSSIRSKNYLWQQDEAPAHAANKVHKMRGLPKEGHKKDLFLF